MKKTVTREIRILTLEDGTEIMVPGWRYAIVPSFGSSDDCAFLRYRFNFSYAHSMSQKTVVFLEGHMENVHVEGDDWVPITSTIPQQVVPREGLEDGIIQSLEQYAKIFMKGDTIIGCLKYTQK